MSMLDQIADIIDKDVRLYRNQSITHFDITDAILAALPDHVRWAADQWQREVANRPMFNEHRRTLDSTWRQVIRHHGGDDVFLCGPTHDDILASTGETQ